MRSYGLALASLLLAAATLPAQQPPVTAPPAAPGRLDGLLQRWEREMMSVQTLVAQCNRTTIDKTYGKPQTFVGTARYQRPNQAVLEMQKLGKDNKPDPQAYEKFLCTGNMLYEYDPQNKQVRVHQLPPPRPDGMGSDDSFLSFMFGMKAEEAKRRYDMRLAKEDQHWIYIEVIPLLPADKADFQRARLVLSASTFLPRQVWFEQPTGNEVQWDIPQVQTNVQLPANLFAPPRAAPPGWNLMQMPKPDAASKTTLPMPPPRIVRPNQ
jgi:TIGR03009 family protein